MKAYPKPSKKKKKLLICLLPLMLAGCTLTGCKSNDVYRYPGGGTETIVGPDGSPIRGPVE